MSGERIAVLGAGPMGLGAAYQLVKDGRKPIIFEADDRVGGMAACFDFGGLSIERYYHFHAISDHAFFEVLRELGAYHPAQPDRAAEVQGPQPASEVPLWIACVFVH